MEPLAPVPYAVVLPSIAEHGVIFPHDDMKLALTSSPSQVVANRSGPVSYTHLDVYKRQLRYWVSFISSSRWGTPLNLVRP